MEKKLYKIYFDFDGVLAISEPNAKALVSSLALVLHVPEKSISSDFKECGLDFLLGKQDANHFIEIFARKINRNVTLKHLEEAYVKVPVNQPLLWIIRELKQQYSVGLVSNNPEYRFEILKTKEIIDIWQVFDEIYLSSQFGKFKKDFFSENCDIKNGIFVDNNNKFLEEVTKCSGKTVYYDSTKHTISYLIDEFRKLDIKIQ